MGHQSGAFVLGVDIGTTGCKTMGVDPAGGVLAEGSASYPISSPRPTYAEQDADLIVDQVLDAARQCLGQLPGFPAAICFDGALHSLLAVDDHDNPLTPVFTWADSRSEAQARSLKQSPDAHGQYMRTGCPANPMYPLAKILWLRHAAPETFRASARFVSIKEYVIHALTGEWLVDEAVASGSGLLNLHSLDWDDDALALVGIERARLSPVNPANSLLKGLRADVARRLGVPPATALVLGGSDAAFSNLGAGATSATTLGIMIGSSGAVRAITNRPVLDEHERTWCYVLDKKNYLVGGAINNGGLVLRWFADNFVESSAGDAVQVLISEAGQVSPGAEGLVVLPFLSGERSPGWNPHARGVVFGLGLHHGRRHVARALLESVAYRIRSVLEAVETVVAPASAIRASGGFLRSNLWVQILADVLGRLINVPDTANTSALGAALWGWYVLGEIPSLDDFAYLVPIREAVQPNAQHHLLYSRLYDLYRDLYEKLGDPFVEISRIRSWTPQ